MNRKRLEAELVRDEDRRLFPYDDRTGKAPVLATKGKITIGMGWNLTDRGLPEEIIDRLTAISIQTAIDDLTALVPDWETHDEPRQHVLLNVSFNLGLTKLSRFTNTLAAFKARDYEGTARGLEHSLWYSQVKARGRRLVAQMRTGQWQD